MNVIIGIVLVLYSLRMALYCFENTVDQPLIGTAFIGMFMALALYTIKVAIDDYTGRSAKNDDAEKE